MNKFINLVILFQLFDSRSSSWSQARADWCQVWIEGISAIVAISLLCFHYLSRRTEWLPEIKSKIKETVKASDGTNKQIYKDQFNVLNASQKKFSRYYYYEFTYIYNM